MTEMQAATINDLKLVHYSSAVVTTVHSVRQGETPHFKPRGLWLSVDNFEPNWRDWCIGESFNLSELTHPHIVELAPKANVRWLQNENDIDEFTELYRKEIVPHHSFFMMDWQRVAEKFQGIVIAPYCWGRRLDVNTNWYYAWDCASACIWDAAAIESITPQPAKSQS